MLMWNNCPGISNDTSTVCSLVLYHLDKRATQNISTSLLNVQKYIPTFIYAAALMQCSLHFVGRGPARLRENFMLRDFR